MGRDIFRKNPRKLRKITTLIAQLPFLGATCLLTSCALIEFTGDAVELTGKVVRTAVRTTGTVVTTTGKILYPVGKAGIAGVSYIAGKRLIQLDQYGNSYFLDVKLNRRHKAKLLLDTGATAVQISAALADRMGIDTAVSPLVPCTLADGSTTYARSITLKEVRLGGVRVKDVRALVLDNRDGSENDGLLGMSLLNRFNFKIDTERNLLILRSKAE
jgi:aspartyl protease family protein